MKKTKFFATTLALLLLLSITVGALPAFAAQTEYDTSGATAFTFSDSEIAVSAGDYGGYEIDHTALAIREAGVYVLSGSCSNGSVTVKKGVTGVTLVLNGLTLTSADTAPIACNKSSGVTIVAAAGTVNTLTDAAYNNDDVHPENLNAENAVIKCKDGSQVTICGSGALNINANGKNGVKSGAATEAEGDAWMVIRDVTLNIKAAVNDGINAEQLLTISSGNITVDAADDGIHSDYVLNIGAQGSNGPVINITNCCEGLEAAELNVYSGDIAIHAEDDCMNAANSDLPGYAFSLNIAGGTLVMDTTAGDGIDSNGTLTISGGTVVVWTASTTDNQPLDADGLISITSGTVLAAGGSAGMGLQLSAEQPYVTFGSSRMMGGGGRPGQRPELPPDGQPDGQPGHRPDRPSDWQPGGQPGERPDFPSNGQPSISIRKGTAFSIQDASGTVLYSSETVFQTGYVFFSSASLTDGGTYTLCANGESIASAQAQIGSSGSGQPGGPGQRPGNPGEQAGQFVDVAPDAWYAGAVRYAAEHGLMSGTGKNQFSPAASTTRAMIMTILARYAGVDTTGDGLWYEKGLSWAMAQGISDGASPEKNITREQFVTMLWRYTGEPSASGSLSGFPDADAVSGWAVSAMEWAVGVGLVEGSDGKLNPGGNASRAETAALLMRFCELRSSGK